jgi:hypothetical protein
MSRRRLFHMPTTHLPHVVIPVFLLALGGCDARPTEPEVAPAPLLVAAWASQNSESTQRGTASFSADYAIECTDGTEYQISVYGYVDMVVHASIDGAGSLHNSVHFNPHFMAVDDLGRTYRGGYPQLNLTTNGSDGSLSQTFMIRLIGEGPTPDIHFQVVTQRTVNGTGEVTVDFARSRISREGCELVGVVVP